MRGRETISNTQMLNTGKSRRGQGRKGFTLVELLLAVSLMLLLGGAVICSFGTLDHGARLEEGATQVELVLRYARAQAASTGRQVKVVFGEDSEMATGQGYSAATVAPAASADSNTTSSNEVSGVRVLWEADPLEAPGKFTPLPGAEPLTDQLNDLVRVMRVRPPQAGAPQGDATGLDTAPAQFATSSTNNAPASAGQAAAGPMPALTCYPDGSSDSAEILVSALDDDETRLSVVTLSGVTGALRHRFISATEDGAPLSEADSAPASSQGRTLVQ